MALTDSQKADVILFLGWPGKTLVPDSTHYNKTVVDRLNNLTADIETQVTSLLTSIAAVRTKLEASTSRMLVKKVGDIELNTDENLTLKTEYKRQLRDLSQLLDIPRMGSSGINVGVRV